MINKKGFSLIEVMIVVVIIGILFTGIMFFGSAVSKKANINSVNSQLRLLNSSIETMLQTKGKLILPPNVPPLSQADQTTVTNYISSMANDFCKVDFDMLSLQYKTGGIIIKTKTLLDPWGSAYTMMINTDNTNANGGMIIFASSGPDGKTSLSTYKNGQFGDDILIMISPKK